MGRLVIECSLHLIKEVKMPYIYQADIWCDSCGRNIKRELDQRGVAPENPNDEYSYDSDEYPKGPLEAGAADYPQHCGSGKECLEGIRLPSGRRIGKILGGLTRDGIRYAQEEIKRGGEVARFWQKHFDL